MHRPVLVVGIAAFAVVELVQAFRSRRGARPADLRAEAVFRVLFLAGILMLPLGRALAPDAVFGPFALGAVVMWAGLLLRWWSFRTLGRFFTVVVKTSADQPVVDRGPYRVLRHPSYTGLLLICAGVGVMLGNWVGAAASFLLVLGALIYRLRIEERALSAALGERYRAYAAGRARLVPYVY
ncbi:methyltransferase family protein [Actinoplanes sp. CA-030573]|uniref:methyltransferase family protein n=1 Tax=Actinoplanes sp. CA-030573 TaxID=3239898 RepID=UPI003D94C1DF